MGSDSGIRRRLDDGRDRVERLLSAYSGGLRAPTALVDGRGSRGRSGRGINLPAMVIVLLIMVLLIVGIRESARFNAAMVDDQDRRGVVLPGRWYWYVEPVNWTPFMPYGWAGVMTGAAVVFFAYIGFDAVSTTAEEAKTRGGIYQSASLRHW